MENMLSLIKRAYRAVKCDFNDRIRIAGITRPQWDVLKEIDKSSRQGIFVMASTVASRIGSDRPTISGIMGRLEKNGWIKQKKSLSDARCKDITLTNKAKRIIVLAEECDVSTLSRAMKGLTEREVKQFMKILKKITDNMKNRAIQ